MLNSTTDKSNNNNTLIQKEITNEEVKQLFNAVGGNMNIRNCVFTPIGLGNLSQYTDTQKINLLLEYNYNNMIYDFTEETIATASINDQQQIKELISPNYYKYTTKQIISDKYKEVFNSDITKYENKFGSCPFFVYISSLDMYILSSNCGGMYGLYEIKNFIYDYEETSDAVVVSVAYAFYNTEDNTYSKYENDSLKVIYESEYDFEFTEDNIKLFNRLEYQFKKNENGRYYVYDILNMDSNNIDSDKK